ncbi:MAG TPA: AsmA-like C-terminal region-containing protein [Planctomycetota bacterium]|nr:AsmA-like C-terminal region-containing protein [Planctomycetota bacterium]
MILRILLVALGVVCLLAGGAWLAVDRSAVGMLRNELAVRGLQRLVQVESVKLPSLEEAEAGGITLNDPRTGLEVAHIDHLSVDVSTAEGWFSPRVTVVRGGGGRVHVWRDEDGLSLVRALDALLATFSSGPDTGEEPAPPPEQPAEPKPWHGAPAVILDDLEVTLTQPDQKPLVIPGCALRVNDTPDTVTVDVQAGSDGGSAVLRFASGGLHHLEVRGVEITPVCALFLPVDEQELASDLQPSGVLDLDLALLPGHGEATRAQGQLRDAGLAPSLLPYPVGEGTLPFLFEDGHLTVSDAQLSFPGGTVQGSLQADATGFTLDASTHDAQFRADFMQLIPHFDDIKWLKPEDGGSLDLSLRITSREGADLDVDGWGGVFMERLRVGPSGVLVEDVVGSLDIHDQILDFHEVSGRCAGGAAQLSGTLNLHTGDFKADASLFDIDIAHLDRALEIPGSESRNVVGWMQGSAHAEGHMGEVRRTRASGQVSVRGGYLWRVPVLDAVLRSLSLARPEDKRSDSLAVRFRVRGQTIYIDELRLDSESLSLQGEGRVSRDGDLDLKITPIHMGGMLGDALRYVQRQIVALDLTGTYSDPHVRVRPLKAVTGPLGDLWDWITGLFGGGEKPASPFIEEPDDEPEPAAPPVSATPPGAR